MTGKMGMWKKKRRYKGFTLIEITASVVIMASMFVVLFRFLGMSIRIAETARDRMLAVQLAQSLVSRLEAEEITVMDGQKGKQEGAHNNLHWRLESSPALLSGLRKITLTVFKENEPEYPLFQAVYFPDDR